VTLIVNSPAKVELRELSSAVEAATSPIVLLDRALIERVIARAKVAPRRRDRVLLHRSAEESLHEMLIALPRESCDIPHMNFRSGKSFHVVHGSMVVMVFSDDGSSVTPYRADTDSCTAAKMVRLNDPYYHTIISLTDYVVFVETNMGPFTGNKFAPWAPLDMDSEAGRQFVEGLREIASRI
jgi:cupin fold WbuC family metalloprotein